VANLDGLLVDVDATLTIQHTYDGDLDVYLVSPLGSRIELFTDIGGSGDNFLGTILSDTAPDAAGAAPTPITAGTAPFTGRFRPEGFLSALEGENPNGSWTLEVTDDAGGDVGSLISWSLDFKVGDDTVRWYEIDTTGGAYQLVQHGDIDPGPGIHTFYPAIAVDGAGNMGITYTESSHLEYPPMMIAGRRASDPLGYTTPGVVVKSSATDATVRERFFRVFSAVFRPLSPLPDGFRLRFCPRSGTEAGFRSQRGRVIHENLDGLVVGSENQAEYDDFRLQRHQETGDQSAQDDRATGCAGEKVAAFLPRRL
jgi:hypothetical protein